MLATSVLALTSALLLADLTLLPELAEAGVDPTNATSFSITLRSHADNSPLTLTFNVTHDYYRDIIRANPDDPYSPRASSQSLTYDRKSKRCVLTRRGSFSETLHPTHTFNYWINPYELPERIVGYDANGQVAFNLTDNAREKLRVVARVVKQVFEEMDLPHKRVDYLLDYYETLDLHFYDREDGRENREGIASSSFSRDGVRDSRSNVDYSTHDNRPVYAYDEETKTYRVIRTSLKRGEFLPIQIHFRTKPYPQSTFMEFVSDRNRVWRVYDKRYYDTYVAASARDTYDRSPRTSDLLRPGNDDDLLYRLRHNLRHSLGVGHTTSRDCVMYPTNVIDLNRPCEHEIVAVHRFLCDPLLGIA